MLKKWAVVAESSLLICCTFPAVIAQEGLVAAPAGAAPENSAVLVSPAAAITVPAAMPNLVSRLRVRRMRRAVLAVPCDGIWWLRMTTPTIFLLAVLFLMPVSEIRGLPLEECSLSLLRPCPPSVCLASRLAGPSCSASPDAPGVPGPCARVKGQGTDADNESGGLLWPRRPGGLLTPRRGARRILLPLNSGGLFPAGRDNVPVRSHFTGVIQQTGSTRRRQRPGRQRGGSGYAARRRRSAAGPARPGPGRAGPRRRWAAR